MKLINLVKKNIKLTTLLDKLIKCVFDVANNGKAVERRLSLPCHLN